MARCSNRPSAGHRLCITVQRRQSRIMEKIMRTDRGAGIRKALRRLALVVTGLFTVVMTLVVVSPSEARPIRGPIMRAERRAVRALAVPERPGRPARAEATADRAEAARERAEAARPPMPRAAVPRGVADQLRSRCGIRLLCSRPACSRRHLSRWNHGTVAVRPSPARTARSACSCDRRQRQPRPPWNRWHFQPAPRSSRAVASAALRPQIRRVMRRG